MEPCKAFGLFPLGGQNALRKVRSLTCLDQLSPGTFQGDRTDGRSTLTKRMKHPERMQAQKNTKHKKPFAIDISLEGKSKVESSEMKIRNPSLSL